MRTRRRHAVAFAALAALLALAGAVAALDHHDAPATRHAAHAGGPAPAAALCDRAATDARTLATQFAAARAGQTICLASGDYGTFYGGKKPGPVVVRAKPGAHVTLTLDLTSTVNLRVEHVTVAGADISGASRDITVAHSRFTGIAAIHADQMTDAHIVFDHNVHANIDPCATCFAGRVHVTGDSGHPSGVLIEHSLFTGGSADGVRADGNAVQIVGNEFTRLRGAGETHTDPIQIYGGTHVVIRGNYFHGNDVAAEIMMANGGDHNVVEDNVISGAGYTYAMVWNSDDGSIIRHNTFAGGACEAGVPCGIISLSGPARTPSAQPTLIRDNVLTSIGDDGEGAGFVAEDNLTARPTPGKGDLTGAPAFAGPLHAYAGYRLSKRSPGRRDASDGSDPGIQ
jgi:hypothetical protein